VPLSNLWKSIESTNVDEAESETRSVFRIWNMVSVESTDEQNGPSGPPHPEMSHTAAHCRLL
jgi:hypothetical protein